MTQDTQQTDRGRTGTEHFIVVGLDGSTASLAALRWAIRKGAATGSRVDVVHAWHAQTSRDIAFGSDHELERGSVCMLQNEVNAALADLSADTEPPTVDQVTQSSRHGRPAAVLAERAVGARLLVLGAHEHTDLHDRVFGRVATIVGRHVDCPVVVVGADGAVTPVDTIVSARTA